MTKRAYQILSAGLLLIGVGLWWVLTKTYATAESDFVQDYAAARSLLERLPIYGPPLEDWVRANLSWDGVRNYHPPTAVFFYIPFALLPYDYAFIVWNLFSLAAYLLTVELVLNAVPTSALQRALWRSFALFWYPWLYTVGTGQVSAVMAFCVTAAYLLLRRGRDVGAGVLLACAAMFKLFPLYFGIYFLFARRFRALAALILTLAAGFAAATAVLGTAQIQEYFAQVSSEQVAAWKLFPVNISILGMLSSLFERNHWVLPLWEISWMPWCGMLVGALLLLRQQKRLHESRELERAYDFALVAMLLLSPIAWMHMLLMVFLPLVRVGSRATHVLWQKLLFIFCVLCFSLPDVYIARDLGAQYVGVGIPWYEYCFYKPGFWGLVALAVVIGGGRMMPLTTIEKKRF